MPVQSEWFFQQAQAAFDTKRAQYQQILDAILSQQLKTPGQRKAELDLLARAETTLRELEESVRKTQREQIKSDGELLSALTKGQSDIAQANIRFNESVRVQSMKSQTDLAIEKSRAERQIDEDAAREKAKASELASAARADAATFGPGIFSDEDPKVVANTAVGYLKNLWTESFESKAKAATTPAQRQAVVDAYKSASIEWLSRQQVGNPKIHAVLTDSDTVDEAMKVILPEYGQTDLGMSADALADKRAADLKSKLAVPTAVGNASTRGVDDQLLLSRREKFQALSGMDTATLGPSQLMVKVDDNEDLTPFEEYLASAAYNRMYLADPEKAKEFFDKYPTLTDWQKTLKGKWKKDDKEMALSEEEKTLLEETELFDITALKALHDGDYPRSLKQLYDRRRELDEQKRKLMEGGDEGQTIESAIQQSRALYRKYYGDAATQTGIASAETLYQSLRGKTPEEVDQLLANLPLDERAKAVARKAAAGEPITDKELRMLSLGHSLPEHLPEGIIKKFDERVGKDFIKKDNQVIIGYTDKGAEITKDVDELTLNDFGLALDLYATNNSNSKIDSNVLARFKESMALLAQLTKANPYLTPYLTHLTATQLDKQFKILEGQEKPNERLPAEPTTAPVDSRPSNHPAKVRSLNDASILRVGLAKQVAPDVVAKAASDVKEQLGRAPTTKDLTASIDKQLANFSSVERAQINELAKQSKSSSPATIQSNLSKIVNPLVDPEKYQQAIMYVGLVSNPQVSALYSEEDNKRIKRELAALKA